VSCLEYIISFLTLKILPPSRSTLFPYTTLFRSVKFCNSVAQHVLGRHKGLSLAEDKLQAHSHESQKQLDSALQDVLDALHHRSESAAAVRTVSFCHPHASFPLVLFISSVQEPGSHFTVPDEERCARVYVSDPGGQMN